MKTLRLTLSRIFKETDLGDKFINIFPSTALSPDFQQVAYMARQSWVPSEHRLMLMNLLTLQEHCLDDRVPILISPISSTGGAPPLDWINAAEIVYRHMPVPDADDPNSYIEALCIFKRANVAAGYVSEVLRKTLRLGVGGGSLKFNPLNGELIYNNQSILDPEKRTLAPTICPFSVVNAYRPAGAKVYLGERLLQTAEGQSISTLISPLHQSLSWVVHSDHTNPGANIYVKIPVAAEPVEVAKAFNPTTLAGWIE